MLLFERREGEGFSIGGIANVKVSSVRNGNRVKIAIEAPRHVSVLRDELVGNGKAADGVYADVRVVIVEDNDDFATLLEEGLRVHGVGTVDRCASAGEAEAHLARLAEDGRRPDGVIVDYHLTASHGDEVVRWIREQRGLKRMPVVMLSCSDEDEVIDRCFDAGSNAYMCKPEGFDSLVGMLGRLLSHWTDPARVA